MSSAKSQADLILDWEGLLEAIQRNPDLHPSVEAERQALAQSLTEFQGLKARQDELTALRQEVTQQLDGVKTRGTEIAMKVRLVARGKIGPKNERLVHFKVAPLRKRVRKAAAVKPPGGETPGTTPEPSVPPSGQNAG